MVPAQAQAVAQANAEPRAVLRTLARYDLSGDNAFGLSIERLDTLSD